MHNQSLPSLDGLTGLSTRGRVDMRPTLLRVLTDLYVQKLTHTPDEERHYTELALRLLDAVDTPTRAAVASRLARHLAPPVKVLQRLASDLPEVAAPLRGHAGSQSSASIAPTAAPARGAPASVAPASTAPADRALAERALADSKLLPGTPASAAPSANPPPTDMPVGNTLEDSDPVSGAPQALDPATAEELTALFFAADAHERRLILLNLDIVAPMPTSRVGVSRDPSIGQRLEVAALARKREDFAQGLARSLRIPREQARRIARDDSGEPIVIAAKALGIPRDVIYRILMFLNPAVGHSVERVHALASLYDEMTPQAATGMVAIWQALETSERPRDGHQPFARDDEIRRRARSDTAVQRVPAQRPSERRNAP